MKSKIISHGDYVKATYGGSLIIWGTVIGTGCTGVTVAVNNERFFCLFAEIFTIRKSRKGCAESRKIVAMLLKELKESYRHILKTSIILEETDAFWKKRKAGVYAKYNYAIYRKAKEMLK